MTGTALDDLIDRIEDHARGLGFAAVGIAAPDPSGHMDAYRAWIASGRHADMDDLARGDAIARRAEPGERDDFEPRALVVVTHPYAAADPEGVPDDPSVGVLARYVRGRDDHNVLRKRPASFWRPSTPTCVVSGSRTGAQRTPRAGSRAGCSGDAGPVLERGLAQRAGLGGWSEEAVFRGPATPRYDQSPGDLGLERPWATSPRASSCPTTPTTRAG